MEVFFEKKGSDPGSGRRLWKRMAGTSYGHNSDLQVPFKVVVINYWLFAKLLACLTFEMEITIVHFSGYLW